MDQKAIQKLTYTINTVILILVFGLTGFFTFCEAEFLVLFSIPTTMVYLVGYYLIRKERLDIYVRLVYFWLTLYMTVTTICLGYKFGFHLYSLSMIPIIFYTEYMAEKLGKSHINTVAISGIIVTCYLISTGYAAYAGPIYEVDNSIAGVFWLFNSAIVLFFLIVYSGIMLKMVGSYESKLKDIAHTDRLTGLYNRHYLLSRLDGLNKEELSDYWIAILDIDNFKKVNDVYGHNCGDYVLKNIAETARDECSECTVCRWGGEEFIILASSGKCPDSILESLREKISGLHMNFEEQDIHVTVTIGTEKYSPDRNVDAWISEADRKLYFGKNNGKNQVVYVTNVQ